MNEDLRLGPLPDLPPELAELDAELSSLRIPERASFGPELEAELRLQWALQDSRPRGVGLKVVAAGVAAVLLVGLVFSPARASLVRLLESWQLDGERAVVLTPPTPVADVGLSTPHQPAPSEADVTETEGEEGGRRTLAAPPWGAPWGDRTSVSFPRVLDRDAVARLMRQHYPIHLQERGIGGTVHVRLWVDSTGTVDFVQIREGSGLPEIDRAALVAASDLRFEPARRWGVPLETWVEFAMVFEPGPLDRLPDVTPPERPQPPVDLDSGLLPAWAGEVVVTVPVPVEAREMLRAALGGNLAEVEARFGPLEGLLEGETPAGASPLRWRAEAAEALEAARVRDPDNPAPYLALGRIRRKQGLRENARGLFEEGARRASRGGRPVSPLLVAELQFERALLLKEAWLAWRDLGSIPAEALGAGACPQAQAPREADGSVSAETLIALSYLCPAQFDRIMTEAFRPAEASEDRRDMFGAFEAAVAAHGAHVGANVELLLALAEEGRWYDVLHGARHFAWASGGHAYALLLGGIALQRLGRSEEAEEEFRAALAGLPEEERRHLTDIRPLLDQQAADVFAGLSGERRREALGRFWSSLDPLLITGVNEREVEHLARTAYAHLRFGADGADPAELWIRYGPPLKVRAVGEHTGLRTEFWDYGDGPDFALRRPSLSGRMDLTPEGRAYLEDLHQVFPHRYGTRGRAIFSLPAQVARFRTPDGPEVEVHTTVPPELAPEPTDSVELGVYLLGPDDERTEVSRRRVSARERTLSLRVPAQAEADRVAVELYHPGSRRAAVLRTPVARGEAHGEDRGISDVLRVSPTAPGRRELSRADRWVEPSVDATPVAAAGLGLLFELYDLPAGGGPYRTRVELLPEGSASSLLLPFRPAGEKDFRPEWSRRLPDDTAETTEYLEVQLRGVSPGAHTLFVRVELPGGRRVETRFPLSIWREGYAPPSIPLQSIDDGP